MSNTEFANLFITNKNLDVVFEDLPDSDEDLSDIELDEGVYGDEEVTDAELED